MIQCSFNGLFSNILFSQFFFFLFHEQYNPFVTQKQFNYPKDPGFVTSNTSFGYFGIFTCVDILYHDPDVVLASRFQADTILFPTAWVNTLPLVVSHPFSLRVGHGNGGQLPFSKYTQLHFRYDR